MGLTCLVAVVWGAWAPNAIPHGCVPLISSQAYSNALFKAYLYTIVQVNGKEHYSSNQNTG
jgi:hypothetical protein